MDWKIIMKVINRESNTYNGDIYTMYKFSTGHEFRQWNSGGYFAYTPSGNYASQVTAHKLARLISQYEDNRVQVQD
jgi:hypothetical protein